MFPAQTVLADPEQRDLLIQSHIYTGGLADRQCKAGHGSHVTIAGFDNFMHASLTQPKGKSGCHLTHAITRSQMAEQAAGFQCFQAIGHDNIAAINSDCSLNVP